MQVSYERGRFRRRRRLCSFFLFRLGNRSHQARSAQSEVVLGPLRDGRSPRRQFCQVPSLSLLLYKVNIPLVASSSDKRAHQEADVILRALQVHVSQLRCITVCLSYTSAAWLFPAPHLQHAPHLSDGVLDNRLHAGSGSEKPPKL